MKKSSDIRTGRHCVFNLHVHLVFVTKYRKNVFTKSMLTDMKIIFEKICNDFDAELIQLDGEKDHVHLLVNYPPKVEIPKLVNGLKGVSSGLLRKKYPELTKTLLDRHTLVSFLFCWFLWQCTNFYHSTIY